MKAEKESIEFVHRVNGKLNEFRTFILLNFGVPLVLPPEARTSRA